MSQIFGPAPGLATAKSKTPQSREKKRRTEIEMIRAWQREYVDPGTTIAWKPLRGPLFPWQVRVGDKIVADYRAGAHGRVLCAAAGVGKSRFAAKMVAAISGVRGVVAPSSILGQWKQMLRDEGVDDVVEFKASTPGSEIHENSVLLSSIQAFTGRNLLMMPQFSLIVLDERQHVGERRAHMLAHVPCAHILSISADPPNSLGCWIIGNGHRSDQKVYTEDMIVVDANDVLPAVHIKPIALDLGVPNYAELIKNPENPDEALEFGIHAATRQSRSWTPQKVMRAIRDALAAGGRTLLYAEFDAPNVRAEIEHMLAAELADLGLTLADFEIISSNDQPSVREYRFDQMKLGRVTARFCVVRPSMTAVGKDLSFFDRIALTTPVYCQTEFDQIVGRVRRHGAAEKEVWAYYARGTHEELILDRRFFNQVTSGASSSLNAWVQRHLMTCSNP